MFMLMHVIHMGHDVYKANDKVAEKNRKKLNKHKIFSVNVMGAIGSGKTTLIEEAISHLKEKYRVAVIAGDVIAEMDSSRFRKLDVPTIPVNTGKECHLDAKLVEKALDEIDLDNTDHQQISEVPTFYQMQLLALNNNVKPTEPIAEPVEIKEYYISHLFFDANVDILTPQNNKKLDQLANLLLIYPKITAELSCFELPTGQKTFNLYFSIKKTEKAAEYLAGKGIPRSRLLLKGYGSSFPLVAKPVSNNISPLYQKLNQRLEIALHDYESEPVIIDIESIKVPENLQDPKGVKFSKLSNQLFYSVQIASISQILQNQAIESVEELFIEVENSSGNYLYMAGMLPSFKEAEKLMSSLIDLGFPDARIVPYINGNRIPQGSVGDYAKKYPDLLFFLAGKKK